MGFIILIQIFSRLLISSHKLYCFFIVVFYLVYLNIKKLTLLLYKRLINIQYLFDKLLAIICKQIKHSTIVQQKLFDKVFL